MNEPISVSVKPAAGQIAEARLAIDGWLTSASAGGLPIPEPRYRPAIYEAA